MKIFVDDERECPTGWRLCRDTGSARWAIAKYKYEITHISLDHDNGDTLNGFKPVAHFIGKEYNAENQPTLTIHSANPIGAKELKNILEIDYGLKVL